MGAKLVSPNELYKGGIDSMLNGVEPTTPEDWGKLIHFWAYNVSPEALPSSIELLCTIYKAPVTSDFIQQVANHYKELARKRQEEMLQKIIGAPVTHVHLKHLRATMSQNLCYEELIAVFKKANLEPSWPNHDSWEALAKLCNALFLMKDAKFKETQTLMAKIIGTKESE